MTKRATMRGDGACPRAGRLDPDAAETAAHLAACAECRALAARYESGVAAWRADASALPLPAFASVRAAAQARLGASAGARGGRGVVRACGLRGVRLWGTLGGVALAATLVLFVALPRGTEDGGALRLRVEGAGAGAGAGAGVGTIVMDGIEGPALADAELGVGARVTSEQALTLVDPATAALTLEGASRMRVEAWNAAEAVVRLEAGAVRADVQKRVHGERFEVRTAQAIVRVVGTKFAVRVSGDATEVETYEGLVRVERASGELVAMVAAGEHVRVTTGSASAKNAAARVLVPSEVPPTEARTKGATAVPTAAPDEPKRVDGKKVEAPVTGAREADAGHGEADGAHAKTVDLADDATLLEEARGLLAAGEDAAAVAKLEGWLTVPHAQAARLHALLGDARRLVGRFEDARRSYEQALAMEGAPPSVVADLTRLLEHDLKRPADAAKQWAAFVAAHPRDPRAAFGLSEEARIAAEVGDGAEADRILRRIVERYGGTAEATRALVTLGRHLLDASDWEGAAALFAGAIDAPEATRAEAALVGLMRARLAQGRAAEVRELGARYEARFPSGARRDEVARILGSLK